MALFAILLKRPQNGQKNRSFESFHGLASVVMNCIEHTWVLLNHAVRQCPEEPNSHKEILQCLCEEWTKIFQAKIAELIGSMAGRVKALKKASRTST